MLVGKCRVAIAAITAPKLLTSDQNQTCIQQLRDLAAAGNAHKILWLSVYRLFRDYVRCGGEYRFMDESLVSTGSQDVVASLTARAANMAAGN
ncbi:hypothetical protein PG994_006130 [Apiospora phragmitis]|uniref:Uncharacterized protein n=1 Tax=Apiospora phragmitis TaxID=2905665 RepID=A0ABR1VHP9_9PEZI